MSLVTEAKSCLQKYRNYVSLWCCRSLEFFFIYYSAMLGFCLAEWNGNATKNCYYPNQFCGSGSEGSLSFWASRSASESVSHIRLRIRLWIVRKTLISTVLWLLYDFLPVFRIRIRIRRIRMFLSLPDLNPDPLDRGTDPRIRIRIRTKMSRIHNTDTNRPCLWM